MLQPQREACTYTACYCEENVYKLLQQLTTAGGVPAQRLAALFISNSSQRIPLWCQRAASEADGLVVWDYHVLVLELPDPDSEAAAGAAAACVRVWDLDTTLPFPCSLQAYAAHALRAGEMQLAPCYQRCYRLVPAASYLRHFASDRRHMRADGAWLAPPPPYPCIVAADGATHSLPLYRCMDEPDAAMHGEDAAAAAWQHVYSRACSSPHGLVLSEDALLGCLLQLHWQQRHASTASTVAAQAAVAAAASTGDGSSWLPAAG